MDVAFKTTDDELFASLVAEKMVEQIKPLLPDMIKQVVEGFMPQKGLTRQQVKEMLNIKADVLVDEIIDRPDFPSYPCGVQRRYWPHAVDKYLTEHNLN